MKQRASLNHWCFHILNGEALVLIGEVRGHPRLPDGAFIHTSRVVRLDVEAATAETLNTFYSLGEKLTDNQEDL